MFEENFWFTKRNDVNVVNQHHLHLNLLPLLCSGYGCYV